MPLRQLATYGLALRRCVPRLVVPVAQRRPAVESRRRRQGQGTTTRRRRSSSMCGRGRHRGYRMPRRSGRDAVGRAAVPPARDRAGNLAAQFEDGAGPRPERVRMAAPRAAGGGRAPAPPCARSNNTARSSHLDDRRIGPPRHRASRLPVGSRGFAPSRSSAGPCTSTSPRLVRERAGVRSPQTAGHAIRETRHVLLFAPRRPATGRSRRRPRRHSRARRVSWPWLAASHRRAETPPAIVRRSSLPRVVAARLAPVFPSQRPGGAIARWCPDVRFRSLDGGRCRRARALVRRVLLLEPVRVRPAGRPGAGAAARPGGCELRVASLRATASWRRGDRGWPGVAPPRSFAITAPVLLRGRRGYRFSATGGVAAGARAVDAARRRAEAALTAPRSPRRPLRGWSRPDDRLTEESGTTQRSGLAHVPRSAAERCCARASCSPPAVAGIGLAPGCSSNSRSSRSTCAHRAGRRSASRRMGRRAVAALATPLIVYALVLAAALTLALNPRGGDPAGSSPRRRRALSDRAALRETLARALPGRSPRPPRSRSPHRRHRTLMASTS